MLQKNVESFEKRMYIASFMFFQAAVVNSMHPIGILFHKGCPRVWHVGRVLWFSTL